MQQTDKKSKYQLLDSGNFMRLEQAGPYRIVRPAAAASWEPSLPQREWDLADAMFHRTGGDANMVRGEWRFKNATHGKAHSIKEPWPVDFENIRLLLKLTSFGHLGLFAEQEQNWHEMYQLIKNKKSEHAGEPVHILNLFAYTGGATLFAALAGAEVVHLDASKGTVKWARDNAEASDLTQKPIRWIVDDAQDFVKKEQRRGRNYHGIILDPPTYGRGNTGQVWKIEDDLLPLLKGLQPLLADDFLFVHLSSHSPGYTPLALANLLQQVLSKRAGVCRSGEMVIEDSTGKPLPSGASAAFIASRRRQS